MTTTYSVSAKARFRLGEALQSTFDTVFANFGVFLLLALAISALPNLLLTLPFGRPTPGAGLGGGVLVIVRAVVNLAVGAILQGALVRGVVLHLNGRRPTFAECLRTGLSSALPLAGIGILAGLGIGLGIVLLIVPGLFLLALWAVVAPAQVVERRGVFASFSRSAELTAGHRWAVLGAILIMIVITFAIILLSGAVVGLIGGLGGAVVGGAGTPWALFAVTSLITLALTSVGTIFSTAVPTVLYYQLRRSKEGAAPAQLAAVFD